MEVDGHEFRLRELPQHVFDGRDGFAPTGLLCDSGRSNTNLIKRVSTLSSPRAMRVDRDTL